MSNPLLRPDDRFRRPSLTDETGHSIFAEQETSSDVISAKSEGSSPPQLETTSTPEYQPRYATVLPHRAEFVGWLSWIGLLFTLCLILPFTSQYVAQGVIFGALGVILSVIASLQAFQELSGIAAGAVDPSGRNSLLISYSLAMMGVVLGIGVIAWVMILVMYGTLDFVLP